MKLQILNTETYLTIFSFLLISSVCNVKGQTQKISPKLDFDESKENTNATKTNGTRIANGQPEFPAEGDRGGTVGGSSTVQPSSSGNSGRSGPKIHGVRITVDTGDTQRSSKESKESVEITESGGKHKKKIGIHTDITFEITGDVDEINSTDSGQRHDKEETDASVPIYKGRDGSSHKSRKPYDPKSNWNPNFSSEHRGYDVSSSGGYYPHHIYPGSSSDDRSSSGHVYRSVDGWSSFIPVASSWTTERSYYEPYRPNTVNGYRAPSWKPCYCMSSSSAVDNRRRRDNKILVAAARPTSAVIHVVDSKLDGQFSRRKKRQIK